MPTTPAAAKVEQPQEQLEGLFVLVVIQIRAIAWSLVIEAASRLAQFRRQALAMNPPPRKRTKASSR